MHWRSTRGVKPVLGFALIALAAAAPGAAQDEQERARQVYQIFKDICLECHGADAKGELDLRTHASLLKGGESGGVVVPHQPDKSILYNLVTHKEEPPMPRKKPKLADADIELIRKWIEDGASLEDVEEAVADNATSADAKLKAEERPITDEERRQWQFQRPVRALVPRVDSPAWQTNPIDSFLLSLMTSKKLTPAPQADRRTLVRRAYLDLLGLPPSPDEVAAFVNDRSSLPVTQWPPIDPPD